MGWWHKFVHDPPLVRAQSVYTLENFVPGGVVFVVAPGPSLDTFPKEVLSEYTTIAVNAACEIISPTFALFQEGILCKKYYRVYTTEWVKRVVTTKARQFIERLLPTGHEIYTYQYLDLPCLRNAKKNVPLYWRNPEYRFLPGRNSISTNALSLACLMGASLVVLVGVDFHMGNEGEQYYANGVHINQGPRLRSRALRAGFAWASLAARKGVWNGPRIISTSPWLNLKGIQRVSVKEAIESAYIVASATKSTPEPEVVQT